jgi:hypothetical protein
MKHLFFLSIMSLSTFVSAAPDWKVVAETTSCAEKIQIMGKEGEKYVMAVRGDEKTKLFPKDGSEFHENSMTNTEFAAKTDDASYRFIQPSYVEANPPKIDVAFNGEKNKRCKMELSK